MAGRATGLNEGAGMGETKSLSAALQGN